MDMTPEIANKLFHIFKDKAQLDDERAGTLAHALLDIDSSINTVFSSLVPKLLDITTSEEEIKETLWDIRDEFRHIEYHIDDARLTD